MSARDDRVNTVRDLPMAVNDYAIVIGVDKYAMPQAFPPTESVPTALRMARWLVEKGDIPVDNLNLLVSPASTDKLPDGWDVQREANGTVSNYRLRLGDQAHYEWPAVNATGDKIIETVKVLVHDRVGKGGGDRLFFVYAGHGMVLDKNRYSECLVPPDFNPEINREEPIAIDALLAYFLTTRAFEKQFFLLDCCRNVWRGARTNLYEIESEALKDTGIHVEQFDMRATVPGSRATASPRDRLTSVILDGLAGTGTMKWDALAQIYIVTYERLKTFVFDEFKRRRVVVGQDKDGEDDQDPRMSSSGPSNPILARLRPQVDVKPVKLTIRVTPPEAAGLSEALLVRAWGAGPGTSECRFIDHIDHMPPLELYPAEYQLFVSGHGYEQRALPIELQSDSVLPVNLVAKPSATYSLRLVKEGLCSYLTAPPPLETFAPAAAPNPTVATSAPSFPHYPRPQRGGGVCGCGGCARCVACMCARPALIHPGPATTTPGAANPPGVLPSAQATTTTPRAPSKTLPVPVHPAPMVATLTVETDDRLAPIKVIASSPTAIEPSWYGPTSGPRPVRPSGREESYSLHPGFYRAQVLTPENPPDPRLIFLEPGEKHRETLECPAAPRSRLFRELLGLLGNETAQVLGQGQPNGTFRAATLLALALHAPRPSAPSVIADRLGLPDVGPAKGPSGLRVLVVADRDGAEDARKIAAGTRVRFWPGDGPVAGVEPLTPSPSVAGLASLGRSAGSGAYWLSVTPPGQVEIVRPVTLADGYLTEVIVSVDATGRTNSTVFLLRGIPPVPVDPFRIRRIDLAQRFLRAGILDAAINVATLAGLDPSLRNRRVETDDPNLAMFGWLAKLNKRYLDLPAHAIRLETLPTLSDLLVLRAVEDDWNPATAVPAYKRALDAGFPMLGALLDRLALAVDQKKIEHPRAELLRRVYRSRLRDRLWTSWTPDNITTGRPITAED
jgi:hypothetical protein